MPRGGKRPGAGAKKGNTNALKTGAHSQRVKILVHSLLRDPEVRSVLLRLSASARARRAYARELAIVMARLLYETPILEAKREMLQIMADATEDHVTCGNTLNDLSNYEKATHNNAFTGEPRNRMPLHVPTEEERNAAIAADMRERLANAKQWRKDREYMDRPIRENPPFTDPHTGEPVPFGHKGPISEEEHESNMEAWRNGEDLGP